MRRTFAVQKAPRGDIVRGLLAAKINRTQYDKALEFEKRYLTRRRSKRGPHRIVKMTVSDRAQLERWEVSDWLNKELYRGNTYDWNKVSTGLSVFHIQDVVPIRLARVHLILYAASLCNLRFIGDLPIYYNRRPVSAKNPKEMVLVSTADYSLLQHWETFFFSPIKPLEITISSTEYRRILPTVLKANPVMAPQLKKATYLPDVFGRSNHIRIKGPHAKFFAKWAGKSKKYEKEDRSGIKCELCGENDLGIGERTLICEGCEGGFHTSCLDISPDDIPENDWFCLTCLFEFSRD